MKQYDLGMCSGIMLILINLQPKEHFSFRFWTPKETPRQCKTMQKSILFVFIKIYAKLRFDVEF